MIRPAMHRLSPEQLLQREMAALSPKQRANVEAQLNPPKEEEPAEAGFSALLLVPLALGVAYVSWRVFRSPSPAQTAAAQIAQATAAPPTAPGDILANIKAAYQ